MKECKQKDYKTLIINKREFKAIERIRDVLEYELHVVILINAKREDPEFPLVYDGGNVFCIDKATVKVLWQSSNRFTNIWESEDNNIVMAYDPLGFEVKLDKFTGKILGSQFTK
ncbi:hypothetical protein EHQ05_07270 [Leptospira yasudae]|uniref:hypothetical protein n=1 Tax=Leptospira yasudae TaxID=2202201 RepID=UPI001083D7FF|nr:hypothetical protein [Leptospira yasudae]TGK28762.1 hypothetical protein EHQ05_07270 [Leptospira yasudae]TGM03122.1 hypothetical protein EHQ86_15930 [Leptospira yasudae]